MDILMLKPVFKNAIWGGKLLQKFGYREAGENAGECWGISAHENGDCVVANGPFAGQTLSWCWKHHRELFGNMEGEVFPLLVKIIGAEEKLSIQVHPDNAYAKVHENGALGKTECWYILDCQKNASIILGHHAKNRQELSEMIHQGRWAELLREVPVKKGDFFQIESGCLHAMRGGILLIETQQSSDVTYRVYDYDRIQKGRKRTLHISQSIDCIMTPHRDYEIHKRIEQYPGVTKENFVVCPFYTLEKWNIMGTYVMEMKKPFLNVSVIEGCGTVNETPVVKGNHFILPAGIGACRFQGEMALIVSYCG